LLGALLEDMLTLEVQPGGGLGFFRLGMPISEAIALIEEHNTDIARVEIQYHQLVGLCCVSFLPLLLTFVACLGCCLRLWLNYHNHYLSSAS
jgi:hypothetical protein